MIQSILGDVRTWRSMPHVRVNLRLAETGGNDPFYAGMVRRFFASTLRRQAKLPVVRNLRHGVATCLLPASFDDYLMELEGSARRNYKKALRSGYSFRRIDYNASLKDIQAIWRSADTRQGPMRRHFLEGTPRAHSNPPSRSSMHDYPYFGVVKDGRVVAYAGVMVAGDAFMIQQIFGHAGHQAAGVVPMLIIGMAETIYREFPSVRFYMYGTYFGASETLRRFKRKLGFHPHRVDWLLGDDASPAVVSQYVYRHRFEHPPTVERRSDATFVWGDSFAGLAPHYAILSRAIGAASAAKLIAKSATATRSAYCVIADRAVVSYGEVNYGRCSHYRVGPKSTVIGPVWTSPSVRGQGFATWALGNAIRHLVEDGRQEIYIDTAENNRAMQTVIERCGFGERLTSFPRYASVPQPLPITVPPDPVHLQDEGVRG